MNTPDSSEHSPVQNRTLSGRAAFRKARSRRQTAIFGGAIAVLAFLFFVGILGVSGLIPAPFGNEFNKPVKLAELGDTPCPTTPALPVKEPSSELIILNTTSTSGLAGVVGKQLEELGYTISGEGNSAPYQGSAKIETGFDSVNEAYTLARYFGEDSRIVLTARDDGTLTVVLGSKFTGLPPKGELAEMSENKAPLVPKEGCVRLSEEDVEPAQSGS